MKKLKIIGIAVVVIAAIFAFKGGEKYTTIEIGSKAPEVEFKMQNTDNKELSLNDIKGEHGTLVVFSCNTCPFVIAWEDRYPKLSEVAKSNNIGMALINSNEAKRTGDDSMKEMISHSKEKGYSNIPYLIDSKSTLANAFGAKTTPHVFLFDKDWKLVYEGAIDDNFKNASEVEVKYLENAMNNLVTGKKIDPSNTKAMGCSIKRVSI